MTSLLRPNTDSMVEITAEKQEKRKKREREREREREMRLFKRPLKLESRFLGEISITSDRQMTPPLWQKVKRS